MIFVFAKLALGCTTHSYFNGGVEAKWFPFSFIVKLWTLFTKFRDGGGFFRVPVPLHP